MSKNRTEPDFGNTTLNSLAGFAFVNCSIRVISVTSRILRKIFTLLRWLVFAHCQSSPHTAQPTSSKLMGSIRLQASLIIACSSCMLEGGGKKSSDFVDMVKADWAFFFAKLLSTENTARYDGQLMHLCCSTSKLSWATLQCEPAQMPWDATKCFATARVSS